MQRIKKKEYEKNYCYIFNKVITFIIVIQFFRGEEIGIIQLTVIVIGLLLDLIAKIY